MQLFFRRSHLKKALKSLLPPGESSINGTNKIFDEYKEKLKEQGKKQYNMRYLSIEWFAKEFGNDCMISEKEITKALLEAIKKDV